MKYLVFVLIALVSVLGVSLICARKGVFETGKLKIYKPCEEEIVPFKGIPLILIITVCVILSVVMQISLYNNTSIVNFVKLYGLFVVVLACAIIDFKRRIIPNILIIIGLVFRIGVYVYEVLTVESIKSILINDLIGLAIGFGFLAIVSLVTRGALGFGDVKLFGLIGITAGSFCTYSTLFVSLVVSVIVSVVGLATRKMGRKDSFPFGPCIAVGYITAILLTSY